MGGILTAEGSIVGVFGGKGGSIKGLKVKGIE